MDRKNVLFTSATMNTDAKSLLEKTFAFKPENNLIAVDKARAISKSIADEAPEISNGTLD